MSKNLNRPEHLLREFLAAGPCNSRAVLAAMADNGLTPKQVRGARERLGVVVQRAGSGAAMHSAWSLPPTEPNICPAEGTNQIDGAFMPDGDALASEAAGSIPNVSPARARGTQPVVNQDAVLVGRQVRAQARAREGCTDAEQRLHRARVEAFVGRGITIDIATEVADALLLADREGRPAVGSCAQCQNLLRGTCPVTPKPAVEIHECWYRRQDVP